jgi:hypothetical protein
MHLSDLLVYGVEFGQPVKLALEDHFVRISSHLANVVRMRWVIGTHWGLRGLIVQVHDQGLHVVKWVVGDRGRDFDLLVVLHHDCAFGLILGLSVIVAWPEGTRVWLINFGETSTLVKFYPLQLLNLVSSASMAVVVPLN